MSPRNVVTDDLVQFHRRMAAGGLAMTTLACVAVPGKRPVGPSPMRIMLGTKVGAISPDGIEELVAQFGEGAARAVPGRCVTPVRATRRAARGRGSHATRAVRSVPSARRRAGG